MKRFSAAALTLTALTLVPCAAQESAPGPNAAQQARIAKEIADRKALHPTATLEFSGGTLASFVSELRRATPSVNIVFPEFARQVLVPALSLKEAPIGAILDAVARMPNPHFETHASVLQTSMKNRPVFYLDIRASQASKDAELAKAAGPRTTVQVFSIRRLVDVIPSEPTAKMFTPETVLSAVDAGMSAIEGSGPEIKYHESTRILIVSGTVAQVQVTHEIINKLESDITQQYIDLGTARRMKQNANSRKSSGNKAKNR